MAYQNSSNSNDLDSLSKSLIVEVIHLL